MECQDPGLVSSSVKVILFDLGGVLLRLRDPLATLIGKYTLTLLSNTNPVHWNRKDIVDPLKSRLRHLILSHETGYLKPDRQAFGHVIERLGCDPDTILFLDDNPLNIDAAKKCGMRSMLTVGIGSLKENLAQVGAA